MPKLLIVDDDVDLSNELSHEMSEHGWTVEQAHNGADGLQMLRNFQYDFILLDWNMPDATGIEVCRQFREEGGTTPIVFLTGRDKIEDKESGLDAGGDDYLTKPFNIRELLARMRSVQRRSRTLMPDTISLGDLEFNYKLRTLTRGDQSVKLSKTEASILRLLLFNRDSYLTGPEIFAAVWSSNSETAEDTVKVHVKFLRNKLAKIAADHILETVRGSGYIIRDQAPRSKQ